MKGRQKREHLDQVVERLQALIDEQGWNNGQVRLPVADVERLINASIWGDD